MDYTRSIEGSLACDQGDLLIKCFEYNKKEFADNCAEIIPSSCNVEIEDNAGCFLQHDKKALVGRYGKRGNVSFNKTDNSLMMRVKRVPTKQYEEAYNMVKSGVLAGASIGFRGFERFLEDGTRTFDDLSIFEVSLVSNPAYKNTSIEARSNNPKPKILYPPELYE